MSVKPPLLLYRGTKASRPSSGPPATLVDWLAEIPRADQSCYVGIWDLDARVGYLPELLELFNRVQQRFVFLEVQAAYSADMFARPERILGWLEKAGHPVDDKVVADLRLNVIANDFYPRANFIRHATGLDYLTGLTAAMVAEVEPEVTWNNLAKFEERAILVSTYLLRDFARRSGKSFEEFVGWSILGELLVAIHFPTIDFHDDRGCLFDYNEQTSGFIATVKSGRIEPECLAKLPRADADAAQALIEAMKALAPPTPSVAFAPPIQTTQPPDPVAQPQPARPLEHAMKKLAVLVPGVMGSELRLGTDIIWPGPVSSLIFPYAKMNDLLREDLVATDVIRSYFFSSQYQSLIDDLKRCNFREDASPRTLYIYPYDWRKDNRLAAKGLADLLDTAKAEHGEQVDFSLVAHSMGGLVSRYYLESGDFADRPAFSSVSRLVTLATPHRGAPVALPRLLGLEKMLWLSKDQVRELGKDSRFPAGYQLLPPPSEPFTWNEDSSAEYGPVDIYDSQVASELQLNEANLKAASEFHAKLDVTKRPGTVRYFCFAGTHLRTTTVARAFKQATRTRVRKVELESGGDGTVPFWSSTLLGVQNLPVGGEHSVIYKNGDLRRTLAFLLGAPGVLSALPERVEVTIRERVCEPQDLVHAALGFGGGSNELDGEVRVERAEMVGLERIGSFRPTGLSYPVRYRGMVAEQITVVFPAPNVPGLYRVAFYPVGQLEPAGSDELFVQEPGEG